MNLTTTTRNFLLRLGCAALVCIVPLARAAVYDFAIGDPGNRSLRLNIPDGVPVVRGLLIYGNGAGSDYRSAATNPEFVAFAQSMGFAVVGTAYWSYFAYGYTPSEYSGWVYGLQQLAAMSAGVDRRNWTEDAMLHSPAWDRLRQLAGVARRELELIAGEPVSEPNEPDPEG